MTRIVPPCVGKAKLFDSTEIEDHLSARALCRDCPLILPCAARRIEVARMATTQGQPSGTWAGQLYGKYGRPRAVVA